MWYTHSSSAFYRVSYFSLKAVSLRQTCISKYSSHGVRTSCDFLRSPFLVVSAWVPPTLHPTNSGKRDISPRLGEGFSVVTRPDAEHFCCQLRWSHAFFFFHLLLFCVAV